MLLKDPSLSCNNEIKRKSVITDFELCVLLQSVSAGTERQGFTGEAVVSSSVPGAFGSVWEQTAGVRKKRGASRASLPRSQRQPDGGRHHAGVSQRPGGAQDGRQPLYHCEDMVDGFIYDLCI